MKNWYWIFWRTKSNFNRKLYFQPHGWWFRETIRGKLDRGDYFHYTTCWKNHIVFLNKFGVKLKRF